MKSVRWEVRGQAWDKVKNRVWDQVDDRILYAGLKVPASSIYERIWQRLAEPIEKHLYEDIK